MTPTRHIRVNVLKMTQQELAARLGTTQATVSRWESDGQFPRDPQRRVREMILKTGKEWDDRWFFEVPEQAA